jgi:ribulose-5-phosphate 4-epimerase/fuculose-1-phosphate aldolase
MVIGRSVLDAFYRLEILENTAQALFHSRQLGAVTTISDDDIKALTEKFQL